MRSYSWLFPSPVCMEYASDLHLFCWKKGINGMLYLLSPIPAVAKWRGWWRGNSRWLVGTGARLVRCACKVPNTKSESFVQLSPSTRTTRASSSVRQKTFAYRIVLLATLSCKLNVLNVCATARDKVYLFGPRF
jgi:hypothetical protein